MNITVNILELADILAHNELEKHYERNGITEDMHKDENADVLEYTEKAQDLFNDLYDEFETLILLAEETKN